uniref:Protein disulfide-isomerase tmx3-like isoform x1 n=1 Tax=Ixodes scapularis TaxID=6945 RepID=A0A4D5RXJ5_IXOSC
MFQRRRNAYAIIMYHSQLLFVTLLGALLFGAPAAYASRVLELSDRFLEVRHEGVWLVKFYAPWCGHCKMLEPIWSQVAQNLVDTDIRVARVDCTRFTSVATEFSVRGFPTVLFIKGHKTVEYKGDRNRDEIVDFGRRMDGPSVHHLTRCEDLERMRARHKVFFLYSEGEKDRDGDGSLKDRFTRMAEEFQPVNYFFSAPPKCIGQVAGMTTPASPAVYVFKDGTSFMYDEGEAAERNTTFLDWMSKERFPTFQKITYGNFYQVLKTGKKIVTAVLEENQIGKISMRMQEFKDTLEAIALNTRELYHEHFVFGWVGAPDIVNSVAMMNLPVPSLLVIKPDTYQYFLPEGDVREQPPSPQAVLELLNTILDGSAVPYGGDSFPYRLYRAYFEAKNSLAGMWRGNPVLTAVLFGLPLGFLSIICYTTCCCDVLEASDDDDEAEDVRHEKKE